MTGLPSHINENLRFLIAEVKNQLDELGRLFKSRSGTRVQRVLDRRGYSENLMLRIQNACIHGIAESSEKMIPRYRAIQSIAADLDRITELALDAINQMNQIESREGISAKRYLSMLDNVLRGIDLIEETLDENDTRLALKLGEFERKTDLEYKKLLTDYTQALKQKKRTEDLIAALLVAHTLERMGDLLLDIGEALLSSILGQPMGMGRYHSLLDSLQLLSGSGRHKDMAVEPLQKHVLAAVYQASPRQEKARRREPPIWRYTKMVYAENSRKNAMGLRTGAPSIRACARILSYKKRGDSASLLIEHLAGMTFEQILVKESDQLLALTLKKLGRTLNNVWKETKPGSRCQRNSCGS